MLRDESQGSRDPSLHTIAEPTPTHPTPMHIHFFHTASKRMSLPGAPRAGGAVGQVLDAAAAKRMSLAGAPKTAASSAGSSGAQAQAAGGAKRIAGSVLPPLPGNPAKRSRI